MVPLVLTVGSFGAAWWYVVIHNAPGTGCGSTSASQSAGGARWRQRAAETDKPQELGIAEEKPQELGAAEKPQELGGAEPRWSQRSRRRLVDAPPQEMGSLAEPTSASAAGKIPEQFYAWFWGFAALAAVLLAYLLLAHGRRAV